MAKRLPKLNLHLQEFIEKQKIFFVSTAMEEGTINLSPKGMDSLRILSPKKLIWINVTGSGNETATHLKYKKRMTIMFCAFDGNPLILRLYGTAEVLHPRDSSFQDKLSLFPQYIGARQIIIMDINLVQTSCGYGVPLMDYRGERDLLDKWAEKKEKIGFEDYWKERNSISLDGLDTGIME